MAIFVNTLCRRWTKWKFTKWAIKGKTWRRFQFIANGNCTRLDPQHFFCNLKSVLQLIQQWLQVAIGGNVHHFSWTPIISLQFVVKKNLFKELRQIKSALNSLAVNKKVDSETLSEANDLSINLFGRPINALQQAFDRKPFQSSFTIVPTYLTYISIYWKIINKREL